MLLGAVAHPYNPTTLEGQGGQMTSSEARDQPSNMAKPFLCKIHQNSQTWWFMPANSATQGTEARKLLEPGRQRLQSRDRTTALQPGWQEWNFISKKKKKKERKRKASSRSTCWQIWHLVRIQFLIHRWCLLAVSSHGGRGEWAPSGLFCKVTNPNHKGSAFRT